jgi:hypothetical protein
MFGGSDRIAWRQSSYCSSGGCVEVAVSDVDSGGAVLVRSTHDPQRVMAITQPAWRALIEAVCAGEFAPPRPVQGPSTG